MADNLTAEIIAIGTEILLGEITDTNSVFLAQCLRDLGINVYYMTSVGDNVGRIAAAVRHALSRAELVITCGGLGPTVDDMTRQGIAEATQRPLVFHQELMTQIEARFSNYRVRMPANNVRQAYVPEGSEIIENPVGTAPVFITPFSNKRVIALPGVPRELKFLMKERIMPYLMARYNLGIIRARVLRAAGVGESALDEMLGEALLQAQNPTVGLAAHHGIIDVRLTAKADTLADAERMLDALELQVMERIGKYVYGRDKQSLEETTAELLLEKQYQLQIVEAGLEGVVTGRLRQHKNASSILMHEHTFATIDALCESMGLARQPLTSLAQEVAKHVGQNSGEHSITLIILSEVDVDESPDNNVATVVLVAHKGSVQQRGYGFGARSELAQTWASRWGLSIVWRILRELEG